jgi:CubicO group peptidase (beta-lactamase class C family)
VNLDTVHQAMAGYVARGEVPALVAAVSDHGRSHIDAIGTPPDTIFRIASLSKPVTAAATMILVEYGTIALDEPVDRLLPELADRRVVKRPDGSLDDTVPAKRPITVHDLLSFTWGFGTPVVDPDTWPILRAARAAGIRVGPPHPQSQAAPDEWIQRLGELPLIFQPGECWVYDTGSDVLSVLIARAAKQPFDAFLRERIFTPLGMKDTEFFVSPADIGRLATSYSGDLSLYDPAKGGEWSRPPKFQSGAGGLVSTAQDFLAFSHMMQNGGAPILSRSSVERMTRDQLTPAQKKCGGQYWLPGYFDTHTWGYGVAIATDTGQYGWDGGLGTVWRVSPKRGREVILLTQRAFTSPDPPRVCAEFLALTAA